MCFSLNEEFWRLEFSSRETSKTEFGFSIKSEGHQLWSEDPDSDNGESCGISSISNNLYNLIPFPNNSQSNGSLLHLNEILKLKICDCKFLTINKVYCESVTDMHIFLLKMQENIFISNSSMPNMENTKYPKTYISPNGVIHHIHLIFLIISIKLEKSMMK